MNLIYSIFKIGFDKDGYDKHGYNKYGYDRQGLNADGYNTAGFDKDGYDKHGYNKDGYDQKGFNADGYNTAGFDKAGYDKHGYNKDGYDRKGFNADGYNTAGFDKDGYDKHGYNKDGYDQKGFNADGYNTAGFDKAGYDKHGYNKDGYDRKGFNADGYNTSGFNKDGFYCCEIEIRTLLDNLNEGELVFLIEAIQKHSLVNQNYIMDKLRVCNLNDFQRMVKSEFSFINDRPLLYKTFYEPNYRNKSHFYVYDILHPQPNITLLPDKISCPCAIGITTLKNAIERYRDTDYFGVTNKYDELKFQEYLDDYEQCGYCTYFIT